MDKKLTDNEIIKALECCVKGIFNCDGECPCSYNNSLSISACRFELLGDVLDLLNRKSEAIKEFAERLKEKIPYIVSHLGNISVMTVHRRIDNLVKEMTGQNDFKE